MKTTAAKNAWTASQEKAITLFGSDVCVPAGAGSGKTAVLVERYLHAVQKLGFKPSDILAITFTDKAAAEMKRRLIEESLRRGLPELRAELERAPIGTIHSFCTRVLRENPVECGIDPEFRIFGDAERELLSARVFDALAETEFSDPQVIEVLALYGADDLRTAFARLLEQSRAAGRERFLAAEPGFEAAASVSRKKLEAALDAVIAYVTAKKTPGLTEAAAAASARAMRERLSGLPETWERLESVAAADEMEKRGGIKEFVQTAREAQEEWQAAEAARLGLPLRRAFLRLFTRYAAMLEEEKKKLAAYDFDDLIEKVLRALRSDDPVCRAWAARTRARFKAVFVDEYQDVNPAQAMLVELLKSPGNRFVVGDRRQSIYGFRRADPRIFDRVRGASIEAPLSDNFRSRKPVLDFVNAFFEDRFTGDAPLTAAKAFGAKSEPCIEILAVPIEDADEGEKPLDRARVLEAQALAARLRALVDSGLRVEPRQGGPRPVEWRDIAVLFRKGTAIRLYDRAFREAGIPFDLPKGKGFFEKNEITDLVSFLSVLDDPHEDIPLAAALRSPLTGLSDDALFLLAHDRPKKMSLAAAIDSRAGSLPSADRIRLEAFRERLERMRVSRERLGVSRVIETLLDETGYRVSMGRAAGPQALANIDKLIDLARETESAGGGVSDFVRLTRTLAQRDEDEPEARMPAEPGNAVSFLTVHSAKGLEFPVVAIADLGAEPKKDYPVLLASAEGEIGLKLKAPDGWQWVADPVYRRLATASAAQSLEESERLLYVAMTRAREHLILSGVWKKPGKSETDGEKSWMRMVFETCGFSEPRGPGPEAWKSIPLVWLDTRARAEKTAPPGGRQNPAVFPAERLVLPEKPYEMVEDVTVTRLVEAASREEIEALLTEEPDKEAATRSDEDDEPPVPANRFGTIFHKLMELSMRPGILGPLSKAEFEDWTREFAPSEKENLNRQVREFWSGPWGAAVRRASRRYPELPFIYKLKQGLLKGQLDLVFRDARGAWTILDYKTNRVTEETLAETARRYELQLALYALVFSELTGEPPAQGVLYFSALGRTVAFPYAKGFEASIRSRLEKVHQELILSDTSAKLSSSR